MIKFDLTEYRKIKEAGEKFRARFGLESPTKKNPAKQMAQQNCMARRLDSRRRVFVLTGSHLSNLINETAKNFTTYCVLPEINHYLLDGLNHPPTSRRFLKFFFLESGFYRRRKSKSALS